MQAVRKTPGATTIGWIAFALVCVPMMHAGPAGAGTAPLSASILLDGFGPNASWETQETGVSLAVALAVEAPPSISCLFQFYASGRGEPSDLTVFFRALQAGGTAVGTAGSFVEVYTPVADHAPGGPGYIWSWSDLPTEGNASFLFAAFNLHPNGGSDITYSFAFDCDGDVTYRTVRAHAIGVTMNGEHNGQAGANVFIAGSTGAFVSETVDVASWGISLFTRFGVNGPCVLEMKTPSESSSYTFAAGARILRHAGAGAYTINVSHVSAGLGVSMGLILGFDAGAASQYFLEPETLIWPEV